MFKCVTKNATMTTNIKVHLKDTELKNVNCIHLVENRDQWQALLSKWKKPLGSAKCKGQVDCHGN